MLKYIETVCKYTWGIHLPLYDSFVKLVEYVGEIAISIFCVFESIAA